MDVPRPKEGCKVVTLTFASRGPVPNNARCPAIAYRGVLSVDADDPAAAFEALFTDNGWPAAWRNGVLPFHHFHSRAHEVLGVYSGRATVQLGGEGGEILDIAAGDVLVVPAGVAHRKISDDGRLGIVGAYPRGQSPDMCRPDAGALESHLAKVASVPTPARDPVFGESGALIESWTGGG